jgi:hypothetical protein
MLGLMQPVANFDWSMYSKGAYALDPFTYAIFLGSYDCGSFMNQYYYKKLVRLYIGRDPINVPNWCRFFACLSCVEYLGFNGRSFVSELMFAMYYFGGSVLFVGVLVPTITISELYLFLEAVPEEWIVGHFSWYRGPMVIMPWMPFDMDIKWVLFKDGRRTVAAQSSGIWYDLSGDKMWRTRGTTSLLTTEPVSGESRVCESEDITIEDTDFYEVMRMPYFRRFAEAIFHLILTLRRAFPLDVVKIITRKLNLVRMPARCAVTHRRHFTFAPHASTVVYPELRRYGALCTVPGTYSFVYPGKIKVAHYLRSPHYYKLGWAGGGSFWKCRFCGEEIKDRRFTRPHMKICLAKATNQYATSTAIHAICGCGTVLWNEEGVRKHGEWHRVNGQKYEIFYPVKPGENRICLSIDLS